jgi:hypothetical protein
MTTFLFWNTAKRDLTIEVARLVQIHDVDVLILAEADRIPVVQLLETANASSEVNLRFHNVVGQERIRLYSRFPLKAVRPVLDSGGISIAACGDDTARCGSRDAGCRWDHSTPVLQPNVGAFR